jgi:hypothetical protein
VFVTCSFKGCNYIHMSLWVQIPLLPLLNYSTQEFTHEISAYAFSIQKKCTFSNNDTISFSPMTRQHPLEHGLLIIMVSRSHSDTPHSVGLLWTSDQANAETSTCQHTTLTRCRHACSRLDSNPQFQHVSGRKPTP